MKRRLIALLLCFAMVLPILPANAAEEEFAVYHDGSSVSSVVLPQYDKVELTAEGEQTSGYQWQIHVSGDMWVDISGADSATLNLSYAMVASLLDDGVAKVRCKANQNGSTVVTDEVTVSVAYDEPVAETVAEEPVVVQEAVVIEGPVISEPETSEEVTVEDEVAVEDNSQAEAEAAIAEAEAELTKASDEWDAAEAALKEAEAKAAEAETAAVEAENASTAANEAAALAAEAAEAEGATEEQIAAAETAAADAQTAAETAATARTAADEAAAAVTAAQERVAAAEAAYNVAEEELAAVMQDSGSIPLVATYSNDVLMASEDNVSSVHVITINYYLRGTTTEVADPYLAEAMAGQSFSMTVDSPEVVGYAPEVDPYVISIDEVTGPATYTVYYDPVNVGFTVNHYQQNLTLSDYDLVETVKHDGKTGETVGDVHKTYEGFTYLLYKRPQIAADGGTVVEVKYDRKYTLVNFDLGGGYGVEPIYAPYGTAIGNVGTPTRAGYTFKGWSLDGTNVVSLPDTVPAEKVTYVAVWEATDSAKVTIVIWGENADDEEYSYIETSEIYAEPGTTITYDDVQITCGNVAHTHTDECYTCNQEAHTHSSECYTCGASSHTHSTACYEDVGEASDWVPNDAPQNPDEGEIYRGRRNAYIYIKGSWYSYSGDLNSGSIATTTCGETESSHTHVDDCLGCGKTVHTHDSCTRDCGKTEHIHGASCYEDEVLDSDLWYYVRSDEVTVAADGSSVMNVYYDRKTFTLTFKDGNSTVYTLTEKWGADISEHWPIVGTNGTTYDNGERWSPSGSDTYNEVLVYLDVMPAESFTLNVSEVDYDTFIMHYMVEALPGTQNTTSYTYGNTTKNFIESFSVTANYNYVTEAEDFFDLDGFTQWTSNPEFNGGSLDINGGGDVYFYYSRNTYKLDFYSGTGIIKTEDSIYYEEPLGSYDFTPTSVPDIYEEGSVVFDGWYLNPDCTGDEYILDEHTMPADNMILYAKWAPIQHEVKIFLTEENADNGTNQLGDTQVVDHRATAVEPAEEDVVNPVSSDYKFVGWFYKDENGVEKAFDFSMGVSRDLTLYAKWSSNVEKEFTVYYKLLGTDTDVAAPTTGKGLVDNSETFDAKVGDDLYAAYKEGFFPDALSKSITLSITDADNEGANSLTFWYTETVVPYTVKYLNKATLEPVAEEKVVANNKKAHVIETFVQVPGLLPDAYQKSLTLVAGTTAEENVIIFYYAADESRAYYAHTHWTMDANGEWQRVAYSENIGNVGDEIAAAPITIDGYTYDESLTETVVGNRTTAYSGPVELTSDGLEIKHYYIEHEVTINYVAVGPEDATDFGSVSPESEKVKHLTGLAVGSTAVPGSAYKLVGWYSDPACTQLVSNDPKYIPSRPSTGWVDGTTYYALFDYNLTTMKVTKNVVGTPYDSDDTFIFQITDSKGIVIANVTLKNGGSVTIKDVTVGETYTVVEKDTSNRYSAEKDRISVEIQVDASKNVAAFSNKIGETKWLTATSVEKNVFGN